MTDNNDMPRTRTIEPIDTPPPSASPTVAMLKADIDSGATGDKVEVFDPGLSPLGTDDEAGGHPNSPQRVALARRMEGVVRWAKGARKTGHAHNLKDPALASFVGLIAGVALVLSVGIAMVR
jgi:hypothetical protein